MRKPRWAQTASDWLIALGLAGLGQYEAWLRPLDNGARGPRVANAVFALLSSLPLAWRRRAPLPVLAVVVVSLTVWIRAFYDASAQNQPDPFIWFLLTIYSVAAYGSRREAIYGALLAAVALLVIALPDILAGSLPESVYAWLIYTLAFVLGRALRGRQLAASTAEQRASRLEIEREKRAREAATEERARIAREIHDVIAHDLSVIVVQAAAERRTLDPSQASTGEVLLAIEQTGRQALTELRRLLGVVRRTEELPSREPRPTLRNLEELMERVKRGGLQAAVRVEGDPSAVPSGVDLCAYRIIQEALTNVLKHARARSVEVALRYGSNNLTLEITDDGRGAAGDDGVGYGLAGMRERVALYQGDLELGPRPGGGYRVRAVLPFEEPERT